MIPLARLLLLVLHKVISGLRTITIYYDDNGGIKIDRCSASVMKAIDVRQN